MMKFWLVICVITLLANCFCLGLNIAISHYSIALFNAFAAMSMLLCLNKIKEVQ
jgi:hypothetical protein